MDHIIQLVSDVTNVAAGITLILTMDFEADESGSDMIFAIPESEELAWYAETGFGSYNEEITEVEAERALERAGSSLDEMIGDAWKELEEAL